MALGGCETARLPSDCFFPFFLRHPWRNRSPLLAELILENPPKGKVIWIVDILCWPIGKAFAGVQSFYFTQDSHWGEPEEAYLYPR